MKHSWRVEDSWLAIDRSANGERDIDRSFADEVAIDFPALGDKVARMCHAFVESETAIDRLRAEITLSQRQAGTGAAISLELPMRSTCHGCGGRGEVWGEPCPSCESTGHFLRRRLLRVSVPAGVRDGAHFTFSISPPHGLRTCVDVRVAVT